MQEREAFIAEVVVERRRLAEENAAAARAAEEARANLLRRLEDRPGDLVGQEVVRLSTMPVLRGDKWIATKWLRRSAYGAP